MKNNNGFSVIALILAIIIIVAIIGGVVYYVTNKAQDVSKVEEEYSKTELAEALEKQINNKIVDASKKIQKTKKDLSTTFNENNMITYLDNPSDVKENPGIDCIDPYEASKKVKNATENGEVYTVYIIKPEALSKKVVSYGKGSFEEGDVFTLEPKLTKKKDGTEKSTGTYEIKYYDNEKNSTVIETVDLYLTNKS